MESVLQSKIHLAVGALPGVTLHRNNTGMGWVGKVIRTYTNGNKELKDCRPLHAGLCVGSSDLIGYVSVIVTPEMVGKRLAVFAAVEIKDENGRPSQDQEKFLAAVERAGGIAGIAKSTAEAVSLLTTLPA